MLEDDPFESPKLLLARADENLAELDQRIRAFLERKPWAHVTDQDPKTGWDRYKIRLNAKLPGGLRAVFGDAIGNLRHTLDQAVCAASAALGVTDLKNVYFPVSDTPEGLESVIKTRCRKVPRELLPYLRSLKPYRRPANFYWAISKLAAANKHVMLAPMLVASSGGVGIHGGARGLGVDWMPQGTWDSTKNELTVALVRPGVKPNYNLSIRLEVHLDDPGGILSGPALPLLSLMYGNVAGALSGIEEETARILRERGV